MENVTYYQILFTLNMEMGVSHGLTPTQVNTINWICEIRHIVHSNQELFFYDIDNNSQNYFEYDLNYCASTINKILTVSNLPTIEFNYNVQYETYSRCYNKYGDYQSNYYLYKNALNKTKNEIESFNTSIETYFEYIDTTYKTHFKPSGYLRSLREKASFLIMNYYSKNFT